MSDIADLGLRVDSAQLGAANRELDRLVPASQRAQQATEALARAAVSGAAAERDLAQALLQEAAASDAAGQATANHGAQAERSFRRARSELINFSRQLNDIGTMAAMGASPLMILASQGGQIADIFTSAEGGAKAFTARLMAMLTPVRLLGGGFLAAGAALAWIYRDDIGKALTNIFDPTPLVRFQSEQRKIDYYNKLLLSNSALAQANQKTILYNLQQAREESARWSEEVDRVAAGFGRVMEAARLLAVQQAAMKTSDSILGGGQVKALLGQQAVLGMNNRENFGKMSEGEADNQLRAINANANALRSLEDARGDLVIDGRHYLSQQQLEIKQAELLAQGYSAVTREQKVQAAAAAEMERQRGKAYSSAESQRLIDLARQAAGAQFDATATKKATSAQETLENRLRSKSQAIAHDVIEIRTQIEAQEAANEAMRTGSIVSSQVSDFIRIRAKSLELEQDRLAAVAAGHLGVAAAIEEAIKSYAKLEERQRRAEIEGQIRSELNPYGEDLAKIGAARGMGLSSGGMAMIAGGTGLAGDLSGIAGGIGPLSGGGGAAQRLQILQVKQEEAQSLAALDAGLKAGLIQSEEDFQALRVEINKEAQEKIESIQKQSYVAQLQMGEAAFGDLADAVGAFTGKSSAAYKTLFAISKAFAIAQATINMQKAISEALALPWPANIPAIAEVASLGSSILSNIASIAMPQGYARGIIGLNGPGTGTSDSIPAFLSRGESVMTAAATERNAPILAAMNAGATVGGAGKTQIIVQHDGSTAIDVMEGMDGRIRMVARSVLYREGPDVAAASQRDPNGKVAKATRDTLNTSRRRS